MVSLGTRVECCEGVEGREGSVVEGERSLCVGEKGLVKECGEKRSSARGRRV